MNTQKKGTLQFCFPGLLGILRNPKWKEFLRSCESFLKKVSICTLTDLNPGFGGPWKKLWKFFVNGTSIMPQAKSFGQTKFWISCTGSKVPFCQFFILPKSCPFLGVHNLKKKKTVWQVFRTHPELLLEMSDSSSRSKTSAPGNT